MTRSSATGTMHVQRVEPLPLSAAEQKALREVWGETLVELAGEYPDLVVLDVMLPDLDGFEVIKRMREGGVRTPVVFLTARDSTDDKIRGLTLGGDDDDFRHRRGESFDDAGEEGLAEEVEPRLGAAHSGGVTATQHDAGESVACDGVARLVKWCFGH